MFWWHFQGVVSPIRISKWKYVNRTHILWYTVIQSLYDIIAVYNWLTKNLFSFRRWKIFWRPKSRIIAAAIIFYQLNQHRATQTFSLKGQIGPSKVACWPFKFTKAEIWREIFSPTVAFRRVKNGENWKTKNKVGLLVFADFRLKFLPNSRWW